MSFKSVEESMGMPPRKKLTRRGGRRKSAGSAGVPIDHMKNLTNAMELGDHAKVKAHAFALIRSLPKAQMGVPSPNDLPDASGPSDAASSGTDDFSGPKLTSMSAMPKANTPASGAGKSMRLASMLRGLKK